MRQFYPFKSIIMFLFLIFRVVVTNLSLSFLKYTVYFYQKDPLKRSSDRAVNEGLHTSVSQVYPEKEL
jgi:hypothetical protein